MSQIIQILLKNQHIVFTVIVALTAYMFWNRDKISEHSFKNRTVTAADIIFCIAAALIVSFKYDLCPLVGRTMQTDSAVYIYVGKQMLQGQLPYVDIFDHKGVLLYIVDAIGLWLTPGSYLGIWILELLNIVVTVFILYHIAALFTDDKLIIYVGLVAVLIGCASPFYEGGNFTEEYALPWICIALYIFLKYFFSDSYRFYEIMLLGVGCAAVLFLRANMVAVWAIFMPLVLLKMIWHRRWKEISVCAAAFILGIATVTLPLLLYMFWLGCLQEMVFCYLTFNFSYISATLSEKLYALKFFLTDNKLLTAILLVSLFAGIKDKKYLYNLLGLIVSLVVISLGGRTYRHYSVIILPLLVAPCIYTVSFLYSIAYKLFKSPALRLTQPLIIIASVMMVAGIAVLSMAKDSVYLWPTGIDDFLQENVQPEDEVLVLFNNVDYYLKNDLSINNRFIYQYPVIDVSDELYELFLEELKSYPPDIVVVPLSKSKALGYEGNMGQVFRNFEMQHEAGEYLCQDFEAFYVYTRAEKG